MHGQNPIRPPEKGDGSILQVKHIFPTLQGEGPFVGQPSVFVRLGGCNLACSFCDTDFEDYTPMALVDIIDTVRTLSEGVRNLVVITGGEPLRQNIAPLCEALLAEDFRVQIETNGTLFRPLPDAVSIVCSPKNTGGGYHKVREDLLPRVAAFKFIISSQDSFYNHVADVGQGLYNTPVYVQPMDEYDAQRNAANVKLATALAMHHGYILSLQMHKLLGIE